MLNSVDQEIRDLCEADLEAFIRLIAPKQVMGSIHSRVCQWWERDGHKSHQLLLLPRDHQKSRLVAFRTVWKITKDPTIRVLYISSTANLAEKQLKFMKDLMTSPIYRKYWPEMINLDEGKREKWSLSEIAVDHPKRREEGVRDPTIFTGGLTTNLVGMHCDLAVLDDIVTNDTAYSGEGRTKVESQYGLLSSIEGADAEEWVVGTRYHPKDLYAALLGMEADVYDDDGQVIDALPIYEIMEEQVEDRGDGTGTFLWPRQQRSDGKWFGFDRKTLAKKRGQYLDKTQFRAQYYNDPNDLSDAPIGRETFQYYEQKFITRNKGRWYFQHKPLNVYAAIDFAYSTNKRSDYTAIVVIGIDSFNNIYVLDVERLKTDKISDYFQLIKAKLLKWDFRKLRAETTAGQQAIVKELKVSYLQPQGLQLSVDESKPMANQGSKDERISAILQPRYQGLQMWHYQGGECSNLEEELVLRRPPHDDIKDALASAIEIAVPPVHLYRAESEGNAIQYNTRFGGVA